ncbi:Non-canonical purine NTP pyrophosphatase [compost metagenome]
MLALVRSENDPRPLIGEGLWHGEIIDLPEGANGFGYDPHFYLPDMALTAASLDPEEKNRVSHRARALRELLSKLNQA